MEVKSEQLRYVVLPSPIGRLFAAFADDGLVRLAFGRGLDEARFRKSLPAPARRVEPDTDPTAEKLATELERYFAGELGRFATKLDLRVGTPFQRRVWEALLRIPKGKTVSYAELARRVGAPRAARAVGQAVGANPIPILVPCHRVIASSGGLGGYSGGLDLKCWLLDHEGRARPGPLRSSRSPRPK